MAAPHVTEVQPGVFQIDHHFLGQPGVIASYLLADGDELALIETGPSTTTDALLAGVRAAGFQPERISKLLLTHIHLDHAGAAGSLVRRFPNAQVYVHPVGAPHLTDPEKLLRSAARIYGDEMERLWGEVLPVPEERLSVLEDGAEVRAGGRTLRALDTPGHAWHHLAFHDAETGALFTGDVAGVRLGGAAYVRPPTPPPELDLEAWQESVRRIRELRPRRLYLTHFGGYDDADRHLDELLARLFFWGGWIGARLAVGTEPTALVEEVREMGNREIRDATGSDALARPYEMATNYRMSVDGFARYFRKREDG